MDNEILGIAKAFFKNIKIDKDHLAEDIIRQVGHKGDYISNEQTLDGMVHGDEYRKPDVFSSVGVEQHQTEGILSAAEKALYTATSIITKTVEPVLASDKQKELNEILSQSCQSKNL